MDTQYLGYMAFDITGTIRDYEYTKRAIVNLNRIIDSTDFREMDSLSIFRYLQDEMEIVSFGNYLKRYIYEQNKLDEPFAAIPEDYYISVIADSFSMNRAPHAFSPVKSRRGNIIRRWLRDHSARRDTVFLLGFGLKMTEEAVSEFLTKVLKERDFRFDDPTETVYWHCYHHGLPYSHALELLSFYEQAEAVKPPKEKVRFWASAMSALKLYLSNPAKLKEYLAYLKASALPRQDLLFSEFSGLYEKASDVAKHIIRDNRTDKQQDPRLSGAFDIEAVLCSGIPRTGQKNLAPATSSVLSRHFDKKRMSRQRLSLLLRRKINPERFDILTLLFLIYAETVEPDWPTERLIKYIDAANSVLARCGMIAIYPVNPYESFLLMCLLAETPLAVYNDVWEMSYDP